MNRLMGILLVLVTTLPAAARPRDEAGGLERVHQVGLDPVRPGTAGIFGTAAPETTFYGGTFWAADSGRWEALRDSVWTFDSGVGSDLVGSSSNPDVDPTKVPGLHATLEGWTGFASNRPAPAALRRLSRNDPRWSGAVCVGSDAGLGGDYSFWCGLLPEEAAERCYLGGQGYGNNWHLCLQQTFAYSGSGSVTLSFDLVNETEGGYDFTNLIVDTTSAGDDVLIEIYEGDLGLQSESFVLTAAAGRLPASAGPITVKFCFDSDNAWSDSDDLNPTDCGAFAIDNIVLSGGVTHSATFETGEDGWTVVEPVIDYGGEWSNLVDLSNLPLPMTACDCGLRDSVLVFEDLDIGGHGLFQDNLAASPWIDLGPDGHDQMAPGKVILADAFLDLPSQNFIFYQVQVQWYPYVCPTGNLVASPWFSEGVVFSGTSTPACFSGAASGGAVRHDFSSIIPAGATQVRIALGVISYCRFFGSCSSITNSTPWFDNVRLGVYGTVGAPYLSARPNHLPQDNFPTNGTVNLNAPGRIDCNTVKGASTPEIGTSLGDTLVVRGIGGIDDEVEVFVEFAFDPGPGTDSLSLAGFYSTVSFVETRDGLDWYEAQLDTAESGGVVYPGQWMTAHIEGSLGFSGTDTDLDVTDPDPNGRVTRLANDIFPDHLFPMGTHLALFYKARYAGSATWFVLPDTTGGQFYTMEVLPSSAYDDETWNCVLLVDNSEGSGGEATAEALRTLLGTGGNNHDGDWFDTFTVQAASSQQGSFGGPLITEYGASLVQALGYKIIVWDTGRQSRLGMAKEDGDVLMPWLTLLEFAPHFLYLTGDDLVQTVYTRAGSEPSAASLLRTRAGVEYGCNTFTAMNCPMGTVADPTGCVGLDPVTGTPVAGSLGRTTAQAAPSECAPRSFDVLGLSPDASFSEPAGDEVYATAIKTSGPDGFASVVSEGSINSYPYLLHRVVTDGLSVGQRRDLASCTDGSAVAERLDEVLTYFGYGQTGGVPAFCRDPYFTAVLELPDSGFRTRLAAVSPNPVRASAPGTVRFSLERGGAARLELFDIQGRRLKVLFDGNAEEGWHEVPWAGETDRGGRVASGVYFLRLSAFGKDQTQRVVFIGR